jgi:GNAT superfamily N-acetyltransferase
MGHRHRGLAVEAAVSHELITLTAQDPDPALKSDRGVTLVTAADRQLHAPDRTLLLVDRESLVARCSCWWTDTAHLEDRPVGVIGHYAAVDGRAGGALLSSACDLLRAHGITMAVGPMDGTPWRRYRFLVDRGTEPPFFLEPDNPDEWPGHWTAAGFAPLASYTSGMNDDLQVEDPRAPAALDRLRAAGIEIRPLDLSRAEEELRRIFTLSLSAFSRNFLFTPITWVEFLTQYQAVLPYVRPELLLAAEQGDALVGFLFALPDLLQARRSGGIDTIVFKTLAVDPSVGGMGLGGALTNFAQRKARELGFRRAIHALMHETNLSQKISNRSARTIRRYVLLSKRLAP